MNRARNLALAAGLATALAVAGQARAEVTDVGADGFALHESAEIAAAPDVVWPVLTAPSKWWDPEHTYSHDAANLTLDPRAGGCWCETLPGGGSVEHMRVVFAAPGKLLRLKGALGPFQAFADGVMTVMLSPKDGGSVVQIDYTIFGHRKDGLAPLAPIADRVIAEQLSRLKSQIETGSPDPAAKGARP